MNLEEMTCFINTYNPLYNKIPVRIVVVLPKDNLFSAFELSIPSAILRITSRYLIDSYKEDFYSSIIKMTLLISQPILELSDDTIKYVLLHEVGHVHYHRNNGVTVAVARAKQSFKNTSDKHHHTVAERYADLYATRNGYPDTGYITLVKSIIVREHKLYCKHLTERMEHIKKYETSLKYRNM